jgi:trk system potassium uptake protein TrkH
MDIRTVVHVLGAILVFIGTSFIFPICFSIYYGDGDLPALIVSLVITVLTGFAMWKLTPGGRELHNREGFGVVTFGWILFALFGSLPFMLCDAHLSFTDAFFETMSGFSTTGATILTDVESLPHGVLFWRSFTHWLGGMGIVVLTIAILPMLGVGGMQMFKAEVPGPSVDKLQPRIRDTAKVLWEVYLLMTAIETVLLMFGGMTFFDALCHTFGTMATGGFSTRNAGIMHFQDPYIEYVIVIFMILAGTNFALHYRAIKGKPVYYGRNGEFLFYLGIIAVFTLLIGLDLFFESAYDAEGAFRKTIFQITSLLTTTGFHSEDYEIWSHFSQLGLVSLMFIGGCAGSTGGGVKVVRVMLAIKYFAKQFKNLIHPHAVVPVRFGRKSVSQDAMIGILGFLLLYFIILVSATLIMALLGLDMVTAVSTVISTLGNIGPGIGAIGPTENFAHIPVAGKWLLSFLMLAGRLEIYTVLIIFHRNFWIR